MAFIRARGPRVLLAAAGLMALGAVGGAVGVYLAFFRDLPDLRRVEDYQPPLASGLYGPVRLTK